MFWISFRQVINAKSGRICLFFIQNEIWKNLESTL
nr:MAG TPA: hypothetical protein [Caudoviricetes sp.]